MSSESKGTKQAAGAAGPPARDSKRLSWWLLPLFGLFVLARVPGLFTDFWLDEIRALRIVEKISSPLDIFTRVHFDTNHWLYSLFMAALGTERPWIWYRTLSIVAGILTVPMVLVAARREGRGVAVLSFMLAGCSVLLTVYASEARGYACVILFALGAYHALNRYLETRRVGWAVLFNLFSVLGFLSHLTFVFFGLAAVVWSAVGLCRPRWNARRFIGGMLSCHLVPALLLSVLYVVDIRHIRHGGGPDDPVYVVVQQFAAHVLGFPNTPLLRGLAALILAGVVIRELVVLRQEGSDRWWYYLTLVFAAPVAVLPATRAGFPFWTERHFLVCLPFLIILFARFAARNFGGGGRGKALSIFLVILYVGGNVYSAAHFLRLGRGRYADAIAYIAAETPSEIITVGSDFDFRNWMLLTYYSRYLPEGKRLTYYSQTDWPSEGPQWLIAHSLEERHSPEPEMEFENGTIYRLEKHFPYAGFSGWHWSLYRRAE